MALTQITQPHDTQYLKWNPTFAMVRNKAFERAQMYIDNEVLRRCDPHVPKRTGTLIRSGVLNTRIGQGEVHYMTPYARRLYYNPQYHFNDAPQRCGLWFEEMKIHNRDAILQGAYRILTTGF